MKRLVVCTLLGCLIVGNSYCFDEPVIGQAGQEEGYATPSDIHTVFGVKIFFT
jgi:hypothetical protein